MCAVHEHIIIYTVIYDDDCYLLSLLSYKYGKIYKYQYLRVYNIYIGTYIRIGKSLDYNHI